jgi:RHS repeat-associated protein
MESHTESGLYYYRARYYDPSAGRFLSEDPLGFKAGGNFYRYVRNRPTNLTDPTGLFELIGFSPVDAAQMTIAIGQLRAKLNAEKCCIDPKLRDRVLDLLQPGNYGSGITFVYKPKLESDDPAFITCMEKGSGLAFFKNQISVSRAALDGTCGCPVPGQILHEAIHLTWGNPLSSTPEGDAYGAAAACFGPKCAKPAGLNTP